MGMALYSESDAVMLHCLTLRDAYHQLRITDERVHQTFTKLDIPLLSLLEPMSSIVTMEYNDNNNHNGHL